MNVLLIQPGYPDEVPYFTRGLKNVGALVFGVGDQPEEALPPMARENLYAYLQVQSIMNEDQVVEAVVNWLGGTRMERIEGLWEQTVLLAARLRERLGVEGMTVAEIIPFRDKDAMKQAVAAAGLRTPRHQRARGAAQCREAVESMGYPAILKPIAGAGSMDTYRVDNPAELEEALRRMGHVSDVNVEEFIDGEEFTFDTICIDGEIAFYNIAWYRPRPLIGRGVEWISPQTVTLRDVDVHELEGGRTLGRAVLQVLGFRTGFTHMEWYLKNNGEVVFGEIAARPPGARSVDIMNFGCDIDLFTGWAEAVVHGTFSQKVERKYNCAIIFKRARGSGAIQRIEGLEHILGSYGEQIAAMDLLPVGAHRRDWKQTLLSDGWVVVRHPDLRTTMEMADHVGTDLQMFAS
ncbi:MAG: ATP-grasp domain-containing protein [Acidobacteriota bacterium]